MWSRVHVSSYLGQMQKNYALKKKIKVIIKIGIPENFGVTGDLKLPKVNSEVQKGKF